jgi:hypothetical protein
VTDERLGGRAFWREAVTPLGDRMLAKTVDLRLNRSSMHKDPYQLIPIWNSARMMPLMPGPTQCQLTTPFIWPVRAPRPDWRFDRKA